MTQYPYLPNGALPVSLSPKKRVNPPPIVGVVLLAVVGLAIAGCGGSTANQQRTDPVVVASTAGEGPASATTQARPAASAGSVEVRVTSCTAPNKNEAYRSTIVVTNHTTKKVSVTVIVDWLNDAGKELASDYEYVNDLAPGASDQEEAIGTNPHVAGTVHCVAKLA